MAKKAKKGKGNKANNNNRSPVGSAPPPATENQDIVDDPAPDPAAAVVEDAFQVC
jgi:hypothetical protein